MRCYRGKERIITGCYPRESEELLSSDDDKASDSGAGAGAAAAAAAILEGKDADNDMEKDFSKDRRKPKIASIWDRRTVRRQFSIKDYLVSKKCCLFDETYSNTVARQVWNKLPNILILAALSEAASGKQPLIKPLSKSHLEHPRY